MSEPSEEAMRFVVKWSSALRLDEFGCNILAKAIDELLAERKSHEADRAFKEAGL